MPADSGSPEQSEDRRDSEKTTLIPASICPGMEFDVGDEIVLKVVATHGDELEVAYAPEKDKKESEVEPSMSQASNDNESAMHGGVGSNYYD